VQQGAVRPINPSLPRANPTVSWNFLVSQLELSTGELLPTVAPAGPFGRSARSEVDKRVRTSFYETWVRLRL
jgi:hypothetical protein